VVIVNVGKDVVGLEWEGVKFVEDNVVAEEVAYFVYPSSNECSSLLFSVFLFSHSDFSPLILSFEFPSMKRIFLVMFF